MASFKSALLTILILVLLSGCINTKYTQRKYQQAKSQ